MNDKFEGMKDNLEDVKEKVKETKRAAGEFVTSAASDTLKFVRGKVAGFSKMVTGEGESEEMDKFREFKESLNETSSAEWQEKVAPAFRGSKRMEAEKFKSILVNEVGDDGSTITNDYDVFKCLSELESRDLRYVLKACLKQEKIDCEDSVLNNLRKEVALKVFFRVFNVYPKMEIIEKNSDVEAGQADDGGRSYQISPEAMEGLRKEIFPDSPSGKKISIDFMEVAGVLPENVTDLSSLRRVMESLKDMSPARTFIQKCCEIAGITCKETKLRSHKRQEYIPVFFHVFDVRFPVEVSSSPEDTAVRVTPSEKKSFVDCDYDDAANILKNGNVINAFEADFDASYTDSSGTMVIYENMPLTIYDHFCLRIPQENPVVWDFVALVRAGDQEIAALGHIENGKMSTGEVFPHLIFDRIKYEMFRSTNRFSIMLLSKDWDQVPDGGDGTGGKVYLLECRISLRNLPETDKTLCIDFGTSNTTAGTYFYIGDMVADKKMEKDSNLLVTFFDETSDVPEEKDLLPTIVYVEDCSGDQPVYKFGYAAKKEIIRAGYDTRATVFYELKRHIHRLKDEVTINDEAGAAKIVKYRDILKEYLLYVIHTAEQQFKLRFTKLHFTAPVKLKATFMQAVNEIFEEYKIESASESLDEGVAVIYHYIAKRVQRLYARKNRKVEIPSGGKDKNEVSEEGRIRILDCGGGTTDLASCEYKIKDSDVGPVLDIKTGFENGESNFGGNNVTYRILQLLKIKIGAHLGRHGNLPLQELITDDENNILALLDKSYDNKSKIYEKFQKKYEEMEEVIPTKFASPNLFGNERQMIKRNFYYLWQMAEAIKVEFYKTNKRVNVDFEDDQDRKLYVHDMEQYYLFVRDDHERLRRYDKPMDKVEITIKEINRLICPDIYALLNTLFDMYNIQQDKGKQKQVTEKFEQLSKYKYEFSGQSCKIALFQDLLKEFIPGRRIHREPGANEEESNALKKRCINGSIEYMKDKARGRIRPISYASDRKLIYDIMMEGRSSEIKVIDRSGNIKVCKYPINTREIVFVVRDSNQQEKNRYHYSIDCREQPKFDLQELEGKLLKLTMLTQSDLQKSVFDVLENIDLDRDNKGQNMYCLFALPAKDGYGFMVCQIGVKQKEEKGKYYIMPESPEFVPFEDEDMQTFFDGDK